MGYHGGSQSQVQSAFATSGWLHEARKRERAMRVAVGLATTAVVAWLLAPTIALAQTYTPPGCSWAPGTSIPVWINVGPVASYGLNEDAFRVTMLNAMAVWAEESGANLDLYYAGDTTAQVGVPNAITIIGTAFPAGYCPPLSPRHSTHPLAPAEATEELAR